MIFVIVLTIFAVVSMCSGVNENNPLDSNAEILAQSLRRQLMKDNYDYTSADSEEASPSHPNYEVKRLQNNESVHKNKTGFDKVLKHVVQKKRKQGFKSNSRREKVYQKEEEMKDQSSVSYSDTKHIVRPLKHTISDSDSEPSGIQRGTDRKEERVDYDNMYEYDEGIVTQHTNKISYGDNTLDLSDHTTTIKYKILKVRKSHRRSGNPAMFIQEETPNSVSIVNLGSEGFPVFKLPRHRRQYMHVPNIGAFGDDDDELSPPPVKETDFTVTEAANQNTDETIMDVEKRLNNKIRNPSLQITVTPDEIFVL